MITNLVIFAFITGLLTGGVIAGAIAWTRDLGLNLKWWKWLMAAFWYMLLLLLVFAAFTLVGEGEAVAGWKILGIATVVMVILGAGLFRLFTAGHKQ
ncbi:MAG: hypothetical protein DRJ13_16875 [Bacteroidetes bacterium]|nr:MAG: hypothetical protein DRJ13_16875 [Bacteroidota bacterium]